MEHFTPISSTIGGVLIGLASALLLLYQGRIAGISGITGGILMPARGDVIWRVAFVAGLVAGGAVMHFIMPQAFAIAVDRSSVAVIAAGLLVGVGTRLGNGCTSGHGVCGISRGSPRSLAATLTFMATGALTVLIVSRLFGGSV